MGKKRPPNVLPLTKDEQRIRDIMTDQFGHFLSDIEFRVAQAYEVSRRPADARQLSLSDKEIEQYSQHTPVTHQGQVYAEDLNLNQHLITGYALTEGTPVNGLTWTSVHVVYGGIDYSITDGTAAAADFYLWFQLSQATGTAPNKTATMQKAAAAAKPTLATGDAIIFLNNSGVATRCLETPIPSVIANNAVDSGALQPLAVTGAKIANGTITTTQISGTAGITGGQISGSAGIVGTQLSASANINGTQLSSSANLLGSQLTNGTVGATQLGQGSVTANKLTVFDHMIY